MSPSDRRRIVIVGGGYSGVAYAIHLIRSTVDAVALTIVEPAVELGRGIAYGTGEAEHRINVPSDRMSLFPDDPDHATRWLFARRHLPDPTSTDARGHHYVPRRLYGRYVGAVLAETLAEAGQRIRFDHRRASATAVSRRDGALLVDLSDGAPVPAHRVVLAFGHARPVLPASVAPEARAHPKLILDPWSPGAGKRIAPTDTVLIVGTGLTMGDVVASLEARGHRGLVTAVSRRGLLSRPHGTFIRGIDILRGEPSPRTALGLLRLLRRGIRADAGGLGWAAYADAFRRALPDLWGALPTDEKRKAVRHLLPFWEVHRFRVSPQVHAIVESMRADGRLSIERAAFLGIEIQGDALAARLRYGSAVDVRRFDAAVICTGPGKALDGNPLIRSLFAAGLARPDALAVGLDVNRRSQLIDSHGVAQPDLVALGPITRGTFGEMTGAPDIAAHIASLAEAAERHEPTSPRANVGSGGRPQDELPALVSDCRAASR